jgi:curved DNA-binding protein CbpA
VLDRLTHFELLDVDARADEETIQRAFHAVAWRVHPDRHRSALTARQHEQLTLVYAQIAEAYRVLRDGALRAAYLKELARKHRDTGGAKPIGDPDAALELLSPKGQRLYRRAMASLRTRDVTSAMLNLKMALRSDPTSSLLRETLADLRRSK